MELTLVQINPAWEDPAANFKKVDQLLAANPPKYGSLVVLPEMFSTGFSLDLEKTCSGKALEAERFLRSIGTRFQVTVIGGITRLGGDSMGRNEAVAYGPNGEIIVRYVKQRPFSGGGEDAVYERGFKGAIFTCEGLQIAPLICYDLRFPELFRGGAKAGADTFVVIAAWPKERIEHWITLLRARAIENQAFVIGVNRTGNDPKHSYCGRSIVVDPHGAVIADAGEEECVLAAVIDPKMTQGWREDFPAYRDFLRWS